ncbi:MAG: glycosyltransferase [Bacteroidetes bacterium]|nr:glycosyltransferase [Bacteroidota bacterium]
MVDLSISVVLYKNDGQQLQQLLNCFLPLKLSHRIYFIDNSPTDELKNLAAANAVQYIFNNKNIGYGSAHNIALRKSINESLYHLVLNPDVEFNPGTIDDIFIFMEQNRDVGQLMPKVFYKNGELQKLCNPLPVPVNLIGRRFFKNSSWTKKMNDEYEMNGFDYDYILNVPNLSGCFMFLRCTSLQQSGLFDERYFMYMEDIDLCRRIHAVAKTIFYPDVSIVHGFEKESYSNNKLLCHHIVSAFRYFNKWGWIWDKQRDEFNSRLFEELEKYSMSVSAE